MAVVIEASLAKDNKAVWSWHMKIILFKGELRPSFQVEWNEKKEGCFSWRDASFFFFKKHSLWKTVLYFATWTMLECVDVNLLTLTTEK